VSGGRIQLEIEELVVCGVASTDRDALARAVELELERLLDERGLPDIASKSWASASETLDEQHAGLARESVGAQIARAVYGALAQ
jgi:hypothetical protein